MEIENLSKTMSNAINELAKLPGIGERTATRLVMYLIRQDKQYLKNNHLIKNHMNTSELFNLNSIYEPSRIGEYSHLTSRNS